MLNIIKEKLGLNTKIYGLAISKKNNTIEYLVDAVDKAPAHMNYETGKFDWGDWNEDEFFIPRPALFANDKFQCYLDINNILRKDNGDIPDCFNNTNSIFEYYMHFGGDKKLYYAYIDDEDGGTEYAYFSNNQVNHNFIPVDFYWGMFPSDANSNSCYGAKIDHNTLHTYAIRGAYRYGSKRITDMENQILNHLLILLAKTKDYDKAYGNLKDYNEINEPVITGIKTGDKGLFWGNNEYMRKMFGIEFYYNHKISDKRELARKKNFSHIKYLLEEADYQLIDSRSQNAFKYNDNGLLTLKRYNPTTKEIIPDSQFNRDNCPKELLDRMLTRLTNKDASFLINELTKRIYALHPSVTDKSIQ